MNTHRHSAVLVSLVALIGCSGTASEDDGDVTGADALTADEEPTRTLVKDKGSRQTYFPVEKWDLVAVENHAVNRKYLVAQGFDAARKEVLEIVFERVSTPKESFQVSFRSPDGGAAFADRPSGERAKILSVLARDVAMLRGEVDTDRQGCQITKWLKTSLLGLAALVDVVSVPATCVAGFVVLGPGTLACLAQVASVPVVTTLAYKAVREDCRSESAP